MERLLKGPISPEWAITPDAVVHHPVATVGFDQICRVGVFSNPDYDLLRMGCVSIVQTHAAAGFQPLRQMFPVAGCDPQPEFDHIGRSDDGLAV